MESLSILFLAVISALAAFISYEFYVSKDGRLRVLIIRLFACKVWTYGGAAIIYGLALPIDVWTVRFFLNLPMFIVMLQLYRYIRNKE